MSMDEMKSTNSVESTPMPAKNRTKTSGTVLQQKKKELSMAVAGKRKKAGMAAKRGM